MIVNKRGKLIQLIAVLMLLFVSSLTALASGAEVLNTNKEGKNTLFTTKGVFVGKETEEILQNVTKRPVSSNCYVEGEKAYYYTVDGKSGVYRIKDDKVEHLFKEFSLNEVVYANGELYLVEGNTIYKRDKQGSLTQFAEVSWKVEYKILGEYNDQLYMICSNALWSYDLKADKKNYKRYDDKVSLYELKYHQPVYDAVLVESKVYMDTDRNEHESIIGILDLTNKSFEDLSINTADVSGVSFVDDMLILECDDNLGVYNINTKELSYEDELLKAYFTAYDKAFEQQEKSVDDITQLLKDALHNSKNKDAIVQLRVNEAFENETKRSTEKTQYRSISSDNQYLHYKQRVLHNGKTYEEEYETYDFQGTLYMDYGSKDRFVQVKPELSNSIKPAYMANLLQWAIYSTNKVVSEEDNNYIIECYDMQTIYTVLEYTCTVGDYNSYDHMNKLKDTSFRITIDKNTKLIKEIVSSFELKDIIGVESIHNKYESAVMSISYDYQPVEILEPAYVTQHKQDYLELKAFTTGDYADFDEMLTAFNSIKERNAFILPEYYLFLSDNADTWDDYNELAEKYLELVPGDIEFLRVYADNKYYYQDEWLEEKMKVLSTDINYLDVYYLNKYQYLYDSGKLEEATVLLSKALKEFPYNPYILRHNIALVNEQGNKEKAKELFTWCGSYDEAYGELLWEMADIELKAGKMYRAKSYYEEAFAIEDMKEHEIFLQFYAYFFITIMDYEKADEILDIILDLNKESSFAEYYKDKIKEDDLVKDANAYISRLDEYLYLDPESKKVEFANSVLKKRSILFVTDFEEYLNKIKDKSDEFTYFFPYKEGLDSKNKVEVKKIDEGLYLQFPFFYSGVGNDVKAALAKNHKATSNLLLDLRNNGGGSIYEAEQILDMFLSECVPATLIDRWGNVESLESDDDSLKFKHIYVLVNENSASSSELVALSLKEYLSNVTIIGEQTLGKGVAQSIITNLEYDYQVWLVTHYWNVKQKNIHGQGIKPDIKVTSGKLEDYLKHIKH